MDTIQDKLEQYMERWSQADRFSGTVLVAQGEQILLSKGYGYANYEYRIANGPSTLYPIASITKLFTAAAIMQLVERGKLQLEQRLGEFIPDYPQARELTLHHLLSFTSGVPDYTELPQYHIRERLTADQIIEWLKALPLHHEPGQGVQKSNSNYVLLAKIIEVVSGMDIEAYLQQNLFTPLQLHHTGVYHNHAVMPNRAYGYSVSGEGVVQAEYYEMSGAYGSGFLYSTADDLFKWTRALTNEAVITKESYRKMITPYGYLWYAGGSAGYGCFVNGDPVDEIKAEGNIYGYTGSLFRYLEGDYTVVLLSNQDAMPIGRIGQGIKDILFQREPQVVVKPEHYTGADVTPNHHLVGEYRFPPTGWRFAIRCTDGVLQVDRLFIQEAKREPFTLKRMADQGDAMVFACEVCDSTFSFHLAAEGQVQKVTYAWDTLAFDYERVE